MLNSFQILALRRVPAGLGWSRLPLTLSLMTITSGRLDTCASGLGEERATDFWASCSNGGLLGHDSVVGWNSCEDGDALGWEDWDIFVDGAVDDDSMATCDDCVS